MLEKRIPLFTLFGFEVKIDLSWLIIALLVTWTLAAGLFPGMVSGLEQWTYWVMGVLGAVGLFLSIIIHEFSHSLVSRKSGMPIKGITLFIFGGVAEMEDEPPDAKSEFLMAGAGPLASIIIGLVFLGIHSLGEQAGWPRPVNGVLQYLWYINFLLAAFNLIPAFPLDGGRILRSALWKVKKDLRWATRVASWIGAAFGYFLIFLGILNAFRGSFVGGIWWVLIGFFIRNASQLSYQRVLLFRALHGEKVSRFMKQEVVTVSPGVSLEELVNDYIYHYHYKMFPVVEGGRLAGCITTREVKNIPRDEWGRKTVRDIQSACNRDNTIAADADATQALSQMNRSQASRLMVVEGDRLVGVIALKDLMKFLSLKLDLEPNAVQRMEDRQHDVDIRSDR